MPLSMMRMCRYYGFIAILLLISGRPACAQVATPLPSAQLNQADAGQPVSQLSAQVAPVAITPSTSGDANHQKFYTINADIREEYDDNIYTSQSNRTGSLKTDGTTSVLFHFPLDNSDFAASLTFGATYFDADQSFDLTSSFLARFTHKFSDRFSIDVRDQTGYFTEPDILQSSGTLYRNGGYINNSASVDFFAQWTPLLSTTTSYSNNVDFYLSQSIADQQDSIENTASQTFGFAIYPKYSLTFSGTYDNISYDTAQRGYSSYGLSTGLSWQALPSLSVNCGVGASLTESDNTISSSFASPTASLGIAWTLGARSHLNFDYTHSVVPTDVATASGQSADRFSTTFSYDINRSFSAHLSAVYTHSEYTQELIQANTTGAFSEDDIAVETGLTYHITSNFDAVTGYTYSEVSSEQNYRDYTRNQINLGFRATY